MPELRKREIAYKLRIGDLLNGTPIVEDISQNVPDQNQTLSQPARERFRFLELGDKRVIRVNIIANVIDKFVSEGEKHWASITLDDATGQLRAKVFGDDISKFNEIQQGDTILIIGVLRSFNQELYVSPEIIKKVEVRYLFVRKLELEKSLRILPENIAQQQTISEQKPSTREEIIGLIKNSQDSSGVSTSDIILKITSAPPEIINSEIIKLIEDGMIYEPRPGKVRWLG
jgi:RPA family protein